MALEADLGIDSIKRIEILSALEERLPGHAEVDPAAVSALRTLGDILEHLRQRSRRRQPPASRDAAPSGPAPAPAQLTGVPWQAGSEGARLGRFAVEVVATPPPGLGLAGLAACKEIHIVGDGDGVARELAALLGSARPAGR